jgi:hypothetical protein
MRDATRPHHDSNPTVTRQRRLRRFTGTVERYRRQMSTPRSVDTTPYHIWTDALHALALARVTSNDWDRGTYVRWAILSACVTFGTRPGARSLPA